MILYHLFEFPIIKKKMVLETFPEVIRRLVLAEKAVVKHNVLALQKMKYDFFVFNVVFLVTLLELSVVVLPSHFYGVWKIFLTC